MSSSTGWEHTYQIPQDIPSGERLHAAPFTAAFADHPGKALLSLVMALEPSLSDGATASELANYLRCTTGLEKPTDPYPHTEQWLPSMKKSGSVMSYAPSTDEKPNKWYMPKSARAGVALSGLMLFVAEEGSLQMPLLGQAVLRADRPNPHRARIETLRYLLSTSQSSASYAELATRLEPHTTSPKNTSPYIIGDLYARGMIELAYDPTPDSTYRVVKQTTPTALRSNARSLARILVDFVDGVEDFSFDDAVEYVRSSSADCLADSVELRKHVATTLSHLLRSGRIERNNYRHCDGKILFDMSSSQRELMTTLIEGIDGFEKQDEALIELNVSRGKEYILDGGRAAQLLLKSRLRSPRDQYNRRQDASEVILAHLKYSQTEKNAGEIWIGLVDTLKKPYSRPVINAALAKLEREGALKATTDRGGKRYSYQQRKLHAEVGGNF